MREPRAHIMPGWLVSSKNTQEHHIEAVVANHMGMPMVHMLERMGVKVRLGAMGDAREAAVRAIDSQSS